MEHFAHLDAAADKAVAQIAEQGDRRLVVRLRREHRGRRVDAFEERVVEAAADSTPAELRPYVQLGELQVSAHEPALLTLGAKRGSNAIVPPLPRPAAVAVDESNEPPLGEGSEEAKAVARDVPRQDFVDSRARRIGPDLGELTAQGENVLSGDLARHSAALSVSAHLRDLRDGGHGIERRRAV